MSLTVDDVVKVVEMSNVLISTDESQTEADDVMPMRDIIEIPAVRYALVALHAVAILLAAVGNGSVVYFILKYRRLRANVTAFLVLNLAVCDLIGATVHQPMRLIDILLPFSKHNESVKITESYCQVTGFFSTFFSGVGIHTILTISQERFLLICYPLKSKGIITVERTIRLIIAIWLLSFCALLPLPISFTYIAQVQLENANVTFCMSDIFSKSDSSGKMYYLFLFCLYFVIPVIVISLTYAKIFHTLHQSLQGTESQDRIVQKVMKSRKNLAIMMLLIAAVFIALHAPLFVTFLFVSLGFAVPNDPIFTLVIIEFLPLLNAVFNPFIYCAHSRTFFRRKMISFLSTGLHDGDESLHGRPTTYSQTTLNSLHLKQMNQSQSTLNSAGKPDHLWINHGCSDPKGDVQV